eukprot:scaffold27422_cov70-Phaeocystis_antarctica.AAC.3
MAAVLKRFSCALSGRRHDLGGRRGLRHVRELGGVPADVRALQQRQGAPLSPQSNPPPDLRDRPTSHAH